MSFELYTASRRDSISPGTCSVNAGGILRIVRADLAAMNINGEAAILVDRGTQRLALRAPRDGFGEPTSPVRLTKTKTVGRVCLRGALKQIGRERIRGRFPLTRKDDLLIVDFASTEAGKKGRK